MADENNLLTKEDDSTKVKGQKRTQDNQKRFVKTL